MTPLECFESWRGGRQEKAKEELKKCNKSLVKKGGKRSDYDMEKWEKKINQL